MTHEDDKIFAEHLKEGDLVLEHLAGKLNAIGLVIRKDKTNGNVNIRWSDGNEGFYITDKPIDDTAGATYSINKRAQK